MQRRREIATVGILIVTALLLQAGSLERQSLWNDEMFTMDIISHSPDEILELQAAHYHHPPLYFHIARFSVGLFGMSAWAIRLPSAMLGALGVGLIYLFTRKLFDRNAGLIAALFCLTSPFYLAYAQEGRPYALAAFLFTASSYAFYLVLYEKNRYAVLFYPIATLALLYTHHWGLFALGSQFAYLLLFERSKLLKNYRLYIPWLAVGIFYLPKLIALRYQFISAWRVSWFWSESPGWGEVYHLLTAFSGSYFKMASSVFSLPLPLQILGAVTLAGLLTAGVLITIRRKKKETIGYGKTKALLFSLFIFGCLNIIPFVISFFKSEIFLWYRYTVIGFPLLGAVIGGTFFELRGSGKQPHTLSPGAGTAVLILIGIIGTIHYMSWQKSNVRDTVLYTDRMTAQQQVDIIIRPESFAPMFNYYYRGTAAQYDEAYLNTELGEIIDTAASFAYISLDVPNGIREYMDVHFDKFAERRFPGEANMGMIVGLYRQKPDLDIWFD